MDAKQLMIGDLVMCQSIEEKYARITEIYLTLEQQPKRMVSLNANGARYCVQIESIEPVPITPEILKNNGFEYQEGWEEWWHECEDGFGSDFQLSITEDGFQ